jgi:hypothetical protein
MVAFFWAPIACVIAAVLALVSTAWSRFAKAPDWIGWALAAGGSVIVAFALQWPMRQPAAMASADWPAFANGAVPLFLTLVLPQVLAYPLTRARPNLRPLVAVVVVVIGAALWAIAGLVVGATGD